MRVHWEEKDIRVGMYVIRESAPKPIEEHGNKGFASSVTYQVGWIPSWHEETDQYNDYVLLAITDGMIILSNEQLSRKGLADHMNEDNCGYRMLTLSELNYMNNRLKGRIEGCE